LPTWPSFVQEGLWTDGEARIPVAYRLYDKATDGWTTNDHFRALLQVAPQRGFAPECVVCDSWSASLDHLKARRRRGWRWLPHLKGNRRVSLDGTGNRPRSASLIAATGTRVPLRGYGFIRVFRRGAPDGDTEHWATDDAAMDELTRLKDGEWAWGIEEYHRGLKHECGVEKAQVWAGRAQRNHIGCAIRAFRRFEQHRLVTGESWWAAKTGIIREAVRAYLAAPRYTLSSTA